MYRKNNYLFEIKTEIDIPYFHYSFLHIQVAQIKEEIKKEYTLAMKRAIVDYILLDKEERSRVNIRNVPKQFYTPSIIRYVGCNDSRASL